MDVFIPYSHFHIYPIWRLIVAEFLCLDFPIENVVFSSRKCTVVYWKKRSYVVENVNFSTTYPHNNL